MHAGFTVRGPELANRMLEIERPVGESFASHIAGHRDGGASGFTTLQPTTMLKPLAAGQSELKPVLQENGLAIIDIMSETAPEPTHHRDHALARRALADRESLPRTALACRTRHGEALRAKPDQSITA